MLGRVSSEERKYSVSTMTMNALARSREHGQADAEHAAEQAADEVAGGDVVLGLVDEVVLVVEVLDLPVVLELVEPVRAPGR